MNENKFILEQKIVVSPTYNLFIGIYPSNTHLAGFLPDPYFKIFNNQYETSADSVARISILRPEYVIHNGRDGKKQFKLGRKEIAFMLKILKDPTNGYDSAWTFMLSFLLRKAADENIDVPYDIYQPMPDYTLLRK